MKTVILFFMILGLTTQSYGQSQWNKKLNLVITNIKNKKGDLKISIQHDPKLFGSVDGIKSGNNRIVPVTLPKTQYEFINIKKGTYAVAVFQDINGNNKLDLDLFDAPVEPYGFSNNPKITNRAPRFAECAFNLNLNKIIEIKLIHPN